MNKNKGITLIEMLIAITLLGIVLTLASNMIIQSYNISPSSSRRMSARQMAEMHITEISRYIRNYGGIEYEIIGGNLIFENYDLEFNNIKDFSIREVEQGRYEIEITKQYNSDIGVVSTEISQRKN